eukprot:CAMPEP_0206539280 /NCGR_PEP_ID=MMETSP0325_2-20121206/8347_1 /ASSEMBLY_ACC=CAM_ASM_000347 /TAXON_ID=2866 /ORGANISM="Crypthecodinium cohnii, Strain Seligo" /LENGTH=423 /DNA_ID=CAMNT_0054036845 /DNA_START=180 /DNA_END=1451 /DNA_ORIENTATION=+
MTAISSSQSAYHPRGSHQPPTPMCAARTMPRARERKVRAKVKAAAAFATPNAESEADPKPTPAEFQPTLGDKNSGEDNSVKPLAQPQTNGLLTPDSGCVALLTVLLASSCSYLFSDVGLSSTSTSSVAAPFLHDLPRLVSAVVGGSVHFMAYFLTLCAYSSASSTVITPLMQLSAVWMLPFSTLAACMGLSSFIRPVHLLSVALICTGGFLPAAGGCLSHVASSAFWKQRAVRLVILAELLVCLYNVILHQTTFEEAAPIVPIDFEPVTPPEPSGSTMQFFLLSRLANGVTCLTMFLLNPSLRVHVSALRNVNFGILATAFAGECLSMMGVCMVTFSYSSFYEPSVVNAAEGGLQQLFNLLFALISKYVLGCGREVEHSSTSSCCLFYWSLSVWAYPRSERYLRRLRLVSFWNSFGRGRMTPS